MQQNKGSLGPNGELVVLTGSHTGRSANDKYVVINETTKNSIWWENNINQMDPLVFKKLTDDVVDYMETLLELFYTKRSIGSPEHYSLGIEFISTEPSAAMFTQYMFKPEVEDAGGESYRILHAPGFNLDREKYGTNSETVIVTCFEEKLIIIIGTMYAGEIKKSMFSAMNFILPEKGILPMHSGANQSPGGESFVFFGLSGTGKTALATDKELSLIGDDEHGLSDKGIFNFEGGCYAKTSKLSPEMEPEIYSASSRFASFLENVELSDDRSRIDFFDERLTENGRSSYPLDFISNRVESGCGAIPKHMFYLCADAFGVLPPVSLLNTQQASDYFLLGYSAKLAGTEVGIKTPIATFSPFFGAPFMLCRPEVYSNLLQHFVKKYNIKIWLINTGWYGGSYSIGKRFPLKTTRHIIRSIQADKLNDCEFNQDEIFKLKIPKHIDQIDSTLLMPKNAWSDPIEYQKVANKLAASFQEHLISFKNT